MMEQHKCFCCERADALKSSCVDYRADLQRIGQEKRNLEQAVKWLCRQVERAAGPPKFAMDWERLVWGMMERGDWSLDIVFPGEGGE